MTFSRIEQLQNSHTVITESSCVSICSHFHTFWADILVRTGNDFKIKIYSCIKLVIYFQCFIIEL